MKIDDVEITRLQAVELRPTDVLVIEVPQVISKEQHDRLLALAKTATGHPGGIIVLPGGATINVLRPVKL